MNIRESQMRVLADATNVGVAVEHVRQYFASECAELEPDELKAKVHRALTRAVSHGFSSTRDQLQFLDVVFALGEDFDSRHPWAGEILNDRSPEALPFRATRLYNRSLQQLRTDDE
jgi:hypothetical protein